MGNPNRDFLATVRRPGGRAADLSRVATEPRPPVLNRAAPAVRAAPFHGAPPAAGRRRNRNLAREIRRYAPSTNEIPRYATDRPVTSMNDLDLWDLLSPTAATAPDATGRADPARAPARLAPLLTDLSTLPLPDRWPFFARLDAALSHPDPAVRAPATASLSGATGHLALRAIVRALDDPAPPVQSAAVAALAHSAASDPSRWSHAAFHPSPAVRRAALAHPPGRALPWYALLLLPDETLRDTILADESLAPVPPENVFSLFELTRRNLLSRDRALASIAAMPIDRLLPTLARVGPWRSDAAVEALLSAVRAERASGALDRLRNDPAPAVVDDLFDLAWDDSAPTTRSLADARSPRERFFEHLASWAADRTRRRRFGPHILASALRVAARRGGWDPLAAELTLLLEPEFLSFKWVPPATRVASARALYRYASRLDRLTEAQLEPLLRLPLMKRDDGHLDLWLVGALLRVAGAAPYQFAERVLGTSAIVTSFIADPAGSAPLFSLGKDPDARKRLLAAIADRGRHSAGSILAGLALVSASDELDFLDSLDARGALAVYASLLEMAARPGVSLSDNKVRRLGEILAPLLAADALGDFLHATLDAPAPPHALSLRLLSEIARRADVATFAAVVRKLDPPRLRRLLGILPLCAGLPYAVESRLAHELARHKDQEVREWCAARTARGPDAPEPPSPAGPLLRLDDATRDRIATCATVDLASAVEPCLRGPTVGLTKALARRRPPGMLSIGVCVALLGSHDPPAEVAEQFALFCADEAEFLKKLDAAVVKQWSWNQRLPLLGNCWLHLWDPHCFAAGDTLLRNTDGFAGALRWAASMKSVVLCRQVFETVARLLELWRFRDKKKLASLDFDRLCSVLAAALPGDMGVPAARALLSLFQSGVAPAAAAMQVLQPRVAAMLPELPEPVRAILQAWIDSRGLAATAARRAVVPADPGVLRLIARSRDLDQLTGYCRSQSEQEVNEATLRLIELGTIGVNRLIDLLAALDPPPLAAVIADSIPLWPEGDAVTRIAAAFVSSPGATELLFTIGAALLEREDVDREVVLPALLDVCRRPAHPLWFRAEHWDRLLARGVPRNELAIELATSPHAHAYRNALELLLHGGDVDEREVRAVADFLRCGTNRMRSLRLRAAAWLGAHNDHTGFPLLLAEALGGDRVSRSGAWHLDLARVPPPLVAQAVRAVLLAGPKVADETVLLHLLSRPKVDDAVRDEALAAMLKDAALDSTRASVVARLRPGASRESKLRRLARTFAWGVVTGREITSRIFSVEMNAGEGLGYTRFETDKVWISPLPILRGRQHAEAVTRGLIVHEFGHHMYHRSPEALRVWKQADAEGYHRLLNLVTDEHLERNLRALDDRFGDDLKKLAAFAFQHSDKEVPLDKLLEGLQARAFDVLTATELRVARKRGCVLVNNGKLLAEMDRTGMSFPRFVRALRMGLGLRHPDEKVAAALALFKGAKFRKSTMPELRDLTLRLRDIFGWEAILIESFAQDAIMTPGAGEVLSEAEGITADELRDAVRRLLEDRKRGKPSRRDGKGAPVRELNLGAEESFDTITTVVPVPFDPAKHLAYSKQVAAAARQMRRYLSQLGLRMEPQRYRVQGKRVDRARVVPAGVLRGDPRLLIARKLRIEADLFLGLLVDCSGSMQMSNHLEKAKLFGTLLAEAAKGLSGIDVRVFGFTDSVIFDAGDADRCAAHSLEAAGGNNDAAALWHAAGAAKNSRRKARLLVMISDGAPTECTTSALKALVTRLSTRMNMCCAQVAVCPIDVKCFPHYVELPPDDNLNESVRRFGGIITRLVQKAIRS